MNHSTSSALRRVLGQPDEEQPTSRTGEVSEDVPVPCAVPPPRTTYRSRLSKLRQRRPDLYGEKADDGTKRQQEQLGVPSDLQRVLGEAADSDENPSKSLIPKDAEEIDGMGNGLPKPMKPVKAVVMEPNDPAGQPEERLTPMDALVAPDATPDAFEPIDPARVPGAKGSKFSTRDAREAAGQQPAAPPTRAALPPTRAAAPAQAPREEITTERAYQLLNVASPSLQHLSETAPSGQALLRQGEAMPEHKPADIKPVLDAMRRFLG